MLWAAAMVAGWPEWRRLAGSWRGWPARRWVVVAGVGLAGLVVTVFVATLLAYPVTGFDPMTYRLVTGRDFAAAGGLPFLPDLRLPIGAQFTEVLFAGALLVADDRLARGLELLAALATAGVLYGWAARRATPRAGLLAVALWVGSPFVVLYATDAYVDVGTALFAAAALAAADRFRQEGGERWAAVAGALAGAGAAARYTGLFFVAAVPLAILMSGRRSRRRAALFAVVAAAVVAGPWYVRLVVETGNPLFPLFPGTVRGDPVDLRRRSDRRLDGRAPEPLRSSPPAWCAGPRRGRRPSTRGSSRWRRRCSWRSSAGRGPGSPWPWPPAFWSSSGCWSHILATPFPPCRC